MRDEGDIEMIREDLVSAVSAETARIHALFLKVFGTEEGAEVLKMIKENLCGLGVSVFTENAMEMARRAGKQEVGLAIDSILVQARGEEAEKARNL